MGGDGENTNGKCTIIIGAGINHWYHANLMYRAGIHALMFCGCVGVNGGGLAHYVGQEKLAPAWNRGPRSRWPRTGIRPSRLQNAPSFHYVHTDQWRYEKDFTDYHTVPQDSDGDTDGSAAIRWTSGPRRAQRLAALLPAVQEEPVGCRARRRERPARSSDQDVVDYVVDQLKSRELKFSVEDPDAPENWPRLWFIWRGNALMASAKGHEYFLKHYLGTHTNAIAEDLAGDSVKDVVWHEHAPLGKLDLVVDLNFRMDTSALYSDIVLPAATWYEKADLNSTDMHSFIHPLSAAVPPCWESKSDWADLQGDRQASSRNWRQAFPGTGRRHHRRSAGSRQPAEIAQPECRDWINGEVEAIPGKTMPGFKVVTRDYKNLYNQYISFGPLVRKNGLAAHGTGYPIEEEYDKYLETHRTVSWEGMRTPFRN